MPRDCKDAQGEVVPCGASLQGGFRFGIVRLIDEPADGSWRLSLRDARAGNTGNLAASPNWWKQTVTR